MALRIPILALFTLLIPFLPGRIMKHKNKEDMAGEAKRKAVTVLSILFFVATDLFLAWKEPDLVNFLLLSAILMLSAVIIVVDTRCRIIPNLCLFPMLLIAAGYLIYNMLQGAAWVNLPYSIISMVMMCMGLIMLTSALHFKGYLGAGDIKYCSVAAFLFTFSPRMMGMLIGTVVSMIAYLIPMFLAKKITMKIFIAFGPFIGAGVMFGICWPYLLALMG